MDSAVAAVKELEFIFLISSFLFIWFKTEFLYSYINLGGLRSSEYEELTESIELHYLDYLLSLNKGKIWNFVFSLLSCVFCLNFWICLAVTHKDIFKFGYFYLISLLIFGLMCKIFSNDQRS